MKKSRASEENPLNSADGLLKKGSSENVLVFLVLAIFLLAVNVFSSHQQFLQKNILQKESGPKAKYLWLTGSADIPAGLYLFTPEQLENNHPDIASLLAEGTSQIDNSTVHAFDYDADVPTAAELPPAVANVFFQPIPINRADKSILTSLPGIGPVLAERIVQRREQQGPFRTKIELLQITGIGPQKYAGLVERITLE